MAYCVHIHLCPHEVPDDDLQTISGRLAAIETKQEEANVSLSDIRALADQIKGVADGLRPTVDDIAADLQRLLTVLGDNPPAAVQEITDSLSASLGQLSAARDELAAIDEAGGEPPAPTEPPAEPVG